MGCFWPKYIMLQLRKYREVMFDGTQDWLKRFEGNLTCVFKNDLKNYNIFSPEHVWKSENLKFDGILLSKIETAWA